MLARRMMLRFGVLAAVGALAVLAFFSVSQTQKADAAPVPPVCTFTTPLPQLILQGGGPDTVTCTFTIHGTPHTLVVDFTLDLTARPPLTIDGCTLDGNAIHRGPCP